MVKLPLHINSLVKPDILFHLPTDAAQLTGSLETNPLIRQSKIRLQKIMTFFYTETLVESASEQLTRSDDESFSSCATRGDQLNLQNLNRRAFNARPLKVNFYHFALKIKLNL